MKMIYRGVAYDYTPPEVDLKSSTVIGKYRGQPLQFRRPKWISIPQPAMDLVYRGAHTLVDAH